MTAPSVTDSIRWRRGEGPVSRPLDPAKEEALRRFMRRGRWVPRRAVESILEIDTASLCAAGESMKMGESDFGTFLCLPTDETPLVAPDELLVQRGVPPRTARAKSVDAWRAVHGWPEPCEVESLALTG
jgi:hypothetical protein